MKITKSLSIIGYISWSGLGFIRGINHYNYNHNDYKKKEDYLYSALICSGFFGTLLYANPLFFPIFVSKEIYRLEVDVRNLENQKKTDYYNDIF